MLTAWLQRLQNAAIPFEGFMRRLWEIWRTDVGRAVLLARWSWQDLPEAIVQQAGVTQQAINAARERMAIDAEVDTRLGAMGIFPNSTPSAPMGPWINPDHAMFVQIMALIRASEGELPAPPGVAVLAERVFRGFIDPLVAFTQATPEGQRPQVQAAISMMRMTGMEQLLRVQAILTFAFALPRDRIPVLIPELAAV